MCIYNHGSIWMNIYIINITYLILLYKLLLHSRSAIFVQCQTGAHERPLHQGP